MSSDDISTVYSLPQGESLRLFLAQPGISEGEIAYVLRCRGLFVYQKTKRSMIPVIMRSMLSPREFTYLVECLSKREDSTKTITRIIPWKKGCSIIDQIPDDLNIIGMLDLDYAHYKIKSQPLFTPVDGDENHLKMELDIERENLAKGWAASKSDHKGLIELKLVGDEDHLHIIISHTAKETKQVLNKVSSLMIDKFKAAGAVDKSSQEFKIMFDTFTNSERIDFLFDLSKNLSSKMLTFNGITDVSVAPEPGVNLPDKMLWMKDKVKDLFLKGESLHSILFFRKKDHRDCTQLFGLDSDFSFDIKGATGNVSLGMYFSKNSNQNLLDSELEIEIKKLKIDSNATGLTKSVATREITKEIETIKLTAFKPYCSV